MSENTQQCDDARRYPRVTVPFPRFKFVVRNPEVQRLPDVKIVAYVNKYYLDVDTRSLKYRVRSSWSKHFRSTHAT